LALFDLSLLGLPLRKGNMLTYFKGRYNRHGSPDGQGYTLNETFSR